MSGESRFQWKHGVLDIKKKEFLLLLEVFKEQKKINKSE